MKRFLVLILMVCLCLTMLACGSSTSEQSTEPNYTISQNEVREAIQSYLQPQIKAYMEAFGVDDISVDIEFKEFDSYKPLLDFNGEIYNKGSVYCTIRDVIVSPTFSNSLSEGNFSDEMLKQLSALEFEYIDLTCGEYEIHIFSALGSPVLADESGVEYTVSDLMLLKERTIVYIASDAQLEHPVKVGDNIDDIIEEIRRQGSTNGVTTSREKCPNCNGSGYVKYYYGSSDLEAYLSGYDPYTVGKCTMCKGKGY